MRRRVPRHQPKMDFPSRIFNSKPVVSIAPPRPPFKDTFMGGGPSRRRDPQPTYPDLFWWG